MKYQYNQLISSCFFPSHLKSIINDLNPQYSHLKNRDITLNFLLIKMIWTSCEIFNLKNLLCFPRAKYFLILKAALFFKVRWWEKEGYVIAYLFCIFKGEKLHKSIQVADWCILKHILHNYFKLGVGIADLPSMCNFNNTENTIRDMGTTTF